MNEIWFEISENAADRELAIAGGNDSANQAEPLSERQIINLVITALIDINSVSVSLQQSGFLSDYDILSTWLFVTVVDNENVHGDGVE